MTRSKPAPIQRDWVSKTLAGALLGLALALGASGVFSQLNADMPLPVRGQLAMWMVAPVWLGTLGSVYFFQSGLRAWLWLAGASLLIHGALLVLRWNA
jgi:hypothetical protein